MKDLNEFTSKYDCNLETTKELNHDGSKTNLMWFNCEHLDCCIILNETHSEEFGIEWGLEFVTSENFHKLQFDYELVKSKRNPIKLRTYFKDFINAIKNDIRFDIDSLEFYCEKEREKVYLRALKDFNVSSLLGSNTFLITLNSWEVAPELLSL